MTKWLTETNVPTLLLWINAVALGVANGLGPADGGLPFRAEFASRLALSLILASWVMRDARKRGHQLCYDFDSFVFFLWPVVIPFYLFRTRGARAFQALLWFIGICCVIPIVSAVTFLLQEIAVHG